MPRTNIGILHGARDDVADLLSRFDKMLVGKVCLARRGSLPPVAEQFADEGQGLARHDGLAGGGLAQSWRRKLPRFASAQTTL